MKKFISIIAALSVALTMSACENSSIEDKENINDQIVAENENQSENKTEYPIRPVDKDGLMRIDYNSNYEYINYDGTKRIGPFDSAGEFTENGLAWVCAELDDARHGLYGYIDTTGEYVIEPQFWNASDFSSNGFAAVEGGYINEKGEHVIESQFHYAHPFADNGIAATQDIQGLVTFINEKGEPIDERKCFRNILGDYFANDNYTVVKDTITFNEGIIDKNLNYTLEPEYENLSLGTTQENGMTVISASIDRERLFGYLDASGKLVIDFQFDKAGDFASNGIACVKKDDKYGYIDETGKYIVEPIYTSASDFYDNGLARVEIDGKYGYIDGTGKYVVDLVYTSAGNFHKNGLAPVQKDGKCGCINSDGEYVIEPVYDGILDFDAMGLAMARKGDQVGCIDSTGEFVFEIDMEGLECAYTFMENGLAYVIKDGKYGLVNTKGEFVVEPKYDEMSAFNEYGLAYVVIEEDERFVGLINEEGNVIIEPSTALWYSE